MRATAPDAGLARVRARVEGAVQGVGFRPYVHRLASAHGLSGFVLNEGAAVALEVEGPTQAVFTFLDRLPDDAPPASRVTALRHERMEPRSDRGFAIRASRGRSAAAPRLPPDLPTCDSCLRELSDPDDRRYRYPFTSCTACGPRFTIADGIPFDRERTTMSAFTMCERCRAEYENPCDRRFHSQTNACADCGPRVRLLDADGTALDPAPEADPVEAAAAALRDGRIVAVKGIGGYHLAVRADDELAVSTLRERKRRDAKPLAVMVGDVEAAGRLAQIDDRATRLLQAPERAIVLLPRLPNAAVAPSVAPDSAELGVLLAYSPLHHMLLADARVALVMTSGNAADEPIAHDDSDALGRLGGIADAFLVHDREIRARADDPVVRPLRSRRPLLIRRSRGHVLEPLALPVATERPLLACGAQLKNVFCLAHRGHAWVGPHVGDLDAWEARRAYEQGVKRLSQLLGVEPEVVAHDLHPDYTSTRFAMGLDLEAVAVQHHHAHFAACLAEHGESGPAVGAIFDGTGYGPDGEVWGGEVLTGGLAGFERAGRLWRVRLPGGDSAVQEPWRMACAWLAEIAGSVPKLPAGLQGLVDEERWRDVGELALSGLASPETTSAGRLFDAVAALCGLRTVVAYEGQAAIALEAAASASAVGDAYPLPLLKTDGTLVLDARETVAAVTAAVEAGSSPADVARRFHAAVACATAEACARAAERTNTSTAVLSGGVFQNRLLVELTAERLERKGLRVLVPRLLPPNDGGIAYGQAAVASAQLFSRSISIDPHGHSSAHMPQPLQKS